MVKSKLEKIGVSLTLICAIHCIATPILLFLLPMSGSKFANLHAYENPIIFFSFLLAFYILFMDYKMHKNPTPLILIGMASFIKIVEFFGNFHSFELVVSLFIAILVTVSYYINWKHRSRCHCDSAH